MAKSRKSKSGKVAPKKKAAPEESQPEAPVESPKKANTGEVSAHPDSKLSKKQVKLLHEKLLAEKARVLEGVNRHLSEALEEGGSMPDETDMAQRHTEQAYLIRFADKERKLLNEIEHALDKLQEGEYGICEGTDEPVGFKRLELRPWTRYSVAYKEQIERERSQHRR